LDGSIASVSKIPGGAVTIYPVASFLGGDLEQDNVSLYFVGAIAGGPFVATYHVFKMSKAGGTATIIGFDVGLQSNFIAWDGALTMGPAGGILYFNSGPLGIPGDIGNLFNGIASLSTLGGNDTILTFSNPTGIDVALFQNDHLNFWLGGIPAHFSTDSTFLYWADSDGTSIWQMPLIGGVATPIVTGRTGIGVIATPINGAAGGSVFWLEGAIGNTSLMRRTVGGQIIPVLNGILNPPSNRCFAVDNDTVFCERNFELVKVSIEGGAYTTLATSPQSGGPVGVAVDSSHVPSVVYWSSVTGSIWGGAAEVKVDTSGSIISLALPSVPPSATPAATTSAASSIASNSATLNGTVNPNGGSTTVHFQYGNTTSYGSTTANQTFTGNTTHSVAANISGLTASMTYHFRIVAHNNGGTSYGSDRTFTTLSATGAAVVITNPATNVASFSATLNGSLDPHGLPTNVHFQYGTTTSYGLTTAPQSQTGNTYRNVSANISSLTASTVYHFRIVATNNGGTTHGSDRTFTTLSATGAPLVTTNPATNVASFSATLNGSLDPHGLPTNVYFELGTTTSYGYTSGVLSQTGNTYRNIYLNISSGLTASTTYHFRMVAHNSSGTRYGSDRTFTTP
jgi:hypothetical protein